MSEEASTRAEVPHRTIQAYWIEHGEELPEGVFYPVDLEEPSCFACGWYYGAGRIEVPASDRFKDLERAHVVPHSYGGSDHPSNLALLCGPCHYSAPDTLDAGWFWSWVARRALDTPFIQYERQAEEIVNMLRTEMSDEQYERFFSLAREEIVAQMMRSSKRLQPTRHWGVGHMSLSTIARVAIEAIQASS